MKLLYVSISYKIYIWHCFLVDKGSDRYASPDTGRAEGEFLYLATSWSHILQMLYKCFVLTGFRRPNLTSTDVRFCRLKSLSRFTSSPHLHSP